MIAIHIDMGSEAGKAFAPKLMMNMYPTYGFFMPNGDILGVVSPFLLAQKPEKFMEVGNKVLKDAVVKRNNTRSIRFEEIGLKDVMAKAKKEKLESAKKKLAIMPENDLRNCIKQFMDEHPEFCDFFTK